MNRQKTRLVAIAAAIASVIGVAGREIGAEPPKTDTLKIFDGKPKLAIVNGYSTSFRWPDVLQRKLDKYAGGKSPLKVVSATAGGTPIAKWIDVQTGRPRPVWTQRLTPKLKEKGAPLVRDPVETRRTRGPRLQP